MEKNNELVYLLHTKFDQRMWDIYTGMAGNFPPYLDMLIEDSKKTQAFFLLEQYGHLWNESERKTLRTQVHLYEDIFAIDTVLNQVTHLPDGNIAENLIGYIFRNQVSILERKTIFCKPEEAVIWNHPAEEIW